jgi:hypothetical protein
VFYLPQRKIQGSLFVSADALRLLPHYHVRRASFQSAVSVEIKGGCFYVQGTGCMVGGQDIPVRTTPRDVL